MSPGQKGREQAIVEDSETASARREAAKSEARGIVDQLTQVRGRVEELMDRNDDLLEFYPQVSSNLGLLCPVFWLLFGVLILIVLSVLILIHVH